MEAPTPVLPMFLLMLLAPAIAAPDLDVAIDPSGNYTVSISGQIWFRAAATRFYANGGWYEPADGSLVLQNTTTTHAGSCDAIGSFHSTTLTWCGVDGGNKNRFCVDTAFRIYESSVIFETTFTTGAEGITLNNENSVASQFPSFDLNNEEEEDTLQRGFYQWSGSNVPGTPVRGPNGAWPADASLALTGGRSQSGVIAVFANDALRTTAVVSAASSFLMTSSALVDEQNRTLAFGVQASVVSLPPGYRTSVILQVGNGIGNTMRGWGSALLRRYGKRDDAYLDDFSLNQLGYTTDNGAFYYYNTINGSCYGDGHRNTTCVGYEETIIALKKDADANKIPIRWILYDSWFYLKENNVSGNPRDTNHGTINWTDAASFIFPSGLRYMYEQTGWPVVGHARAWSTHNVYAKQNGGDFDFTFDENDMGDKLALPTSHTFWDYMLGHNKKWGLINYQQDWMFTQQGMHSMLRDATIARRWSLQMSQALTRNGQHFGCVQTDAVRSSCSFSAR